MQAVPGLWGLTVRKTATAIALLLAVSTALAQEDLSSKRDYSDPVQRGRPIACKAGDIEGFPGKSLGEVFGADWPVQPVPSLPGGYAEPSVVERARIHWPRGMAPQDSIVVVAVLVDPSGTPLRAEVLCSTRMGLNKSMRRTMMESTYSPATVDGRPITSVLVAAQVVSARERTGPKKPRRIY